MGRRGTLLQLAAKWPTDQWRGNGYDENGAYTLNGAITNSALMAITRNAGATYFIPSENEWYKAAYYDPNKPGGAGYWTYPTKSNTAPINILSSTGTNNANFYDYLARQRRPHRSDELPDAGRGVCGIAGAYGTFDMGGDVWQWNEAAVSGSSRGVRGGAWFGDSDSLASSWPQRRRPDGRWQRT